MLTKKEFYEFHCKKQGEKAVSESAFRKRLSSGRNVRDAIETPKIFASYDPFFQCNARSEEEMSEKEPGYKSKNLGTMYIKYPEIVQERIYYINGNVLNLCDRVNDICEKTARIERRQKVIKQTLMIMLLVLLLYGIARLFSFIS